MHQIKWGILAPGKIAGVFATALNGIPTAHCYAVASRSSKKAQTFADQHGFERAYGSYADLINDPLVDAVYIASPHSLHTEQSLMCLNAGKATLCEKPMTVNVGEAQRVMAAAKANNTFYMEAVWSRFNPVLKQVQTWVKEGRIGELKMLQASFGFQIPKSIENRLYNTHLAGGATLDMGIYPITFSQMMLGQAPLEIKALGHVSEELNIDEQVGMLLTYPGGKLAVLSAAISTETSHQGWIYGSTGKIKVDARFWSSEAATLYSAEGEEELRIEHEINGYEGEIYEVHRCLREGLMQSPTMPWQESLTVMQIMDEVRAQLGLAYPFE